MKELFLSFIFGAVFTFGYNINYANASESCSLKNEVLGLAKELSINTSEDLFSIDQRMNELEQKILQVCSTDSSTNELLEAVSALRERYGSI